MLFAIFFQEKKEKRDQICIISKRIDAEYVSRTLTNVKAKTGNKRFNKVKKSGKRVSSMKKTLRFYAAVVSDSFPFENNYNYKMLIVVRVEHLPFLGIGNKIS